MILNLSILCDSTTTGFSIYLLYVIELPHDSEPTDFI
jgi:hypothetical protein